MGKIERIQLAPGDRERLEKLVRDRNTPQKVVWRARIVLLAGDGVASAPHGLSALFEAFCRCGRDPGGSATSLPPALLAADRSWTAEQWVAEGRAALLQPVNADARTARRAGADAAGAGVPPGAGGSGTRRRLQAIEPRQARGLPSDARTAAALSERPEHR